MKFSFNTFGGNMRDLRVKTGGIELQIREYEQDASPIIFLHFGGGNLMMWQRVVPQFHEYYRLILVDLRDHGKSVQAPGRRAY